MEAWSPGTDEAQHSQVAQHLLGSQATGGQQAASPGSQHNAHFLDI